MAAGIKLGIRLKAPAFMLPTNNPINSDMTKAENKPPTKPAMDVKATEHDVLCLETPDQELTFSKAGLISWKLSGKTAGREILDGPPAFNFWRAPTDNDGIKGQPDQQSKAWAHWLDLGLDNIEWQHNMDIRESPSRTTVIIDSTGSCKGGTLKVKTEYTIIVEGIRVRHRFQVPKPFRDLPRVGIRWQLAGNLETLTWFGNGPHETYSDRKVSAIRKVHESTVGQQYVPYVLPQEHGNLTDVSWLSLRDDQLTVTMRADSKIEASASHYPHEILTPAFHTYEITPHPSAWLSLDARQRGLGGASCGPDTLPAYRIGPGRYELSYEMTVKTGS